MKNGMEKYFKASLLLSLIANAYGASTLCAVVQSAPTRTLTAQKACCNCREYHCSGCQEVETLHSECLRTHTRTVPFSWSAVQ